MQLKRLGALLLLLGLLLMGCNRTESPNSTETAVIESENSDTGTNQVEATSTTKVDEPERATEALSPPATDILIPTNTPEPVPTETATSVSVEQESTPLSIEDITIEASDGLMIQATFWGVQHAPPQPGVILLHMLGSERSVWETTGFAEHLSDNGYAVLSVDMRGHGETGGSRDWDLTADDLQCVWAYFVGREEVEATRTAVIGASIGANMTLITGVNEPSIKTLVLLSPGLDYRGVTTDDKINAYGERPLLIVASEEDTYAATSSETLIDQAQGTAHLEMYTGAGHGTNMFAAEPGLADLILDWLNRHLPDV